jgi:hypothetical protein
LKRRAKRIDLSEIRRLVRQGRYKFTQHALKRSDQRGILIGEIESILQNGEIVEEYPEDTPYPSFLMLGYRGDTPLYVLGAQGKDMIHIITVHWLDPAKWLDPKTRREKP